MVPARLNVVTLGARDLPRLRDFYTGLGWEVAIGTPPPGDPIELEGRNAYFADPEENYWEVVYLKSGASGQGSVDQEED